MERCFVHPPRMMCDQCGAYNPGDVILNEPRRLWKKSEVDEAWKTMSEVEIDLFKECFAFYKIGEKQLGQAASLAMEDVAEYRELLNALEGSEPVYEPGRTFLERVAEIAQAREQNRLMQYWQEWKP